jgi:hypothetical protein
LPDGQVQCRGLVVSGANGTVIFTLPPGYRPNGRDFIWAAKDAGASTASDLRVSSSGQVIVTGAGASGWTSLAVVEFDTETVTEWSVGPKGDKGDRGADGIPGDQARVVSARAYRAASLSVPQGSWTKVPLDTKSFDYHNNLYDVANGRFVAPSDGVYSVSGAVTYAVSPTGTYTYVLAAIYKNGVTYSDPQNSPAVNNHVCGIVADTVEMKQGDYLELWAYLNYQAGSVIVGPAQTFMSVTLAAAGPGAKGDKGDPGTASFADQVHMINVSDLANPELCNFTGLDGNQDIEYEIVLDVIIAGAAVNGYCWIQPNTQYSGFNQWVENRTFTSDGATFNNDAVGKTTSVPYGFPAGHADWNTGGRIHSVIRISALLINPPQAMGRSSNHEGSFVPAGYPSYCMTWRGGVNWWDGATNINSLRVGYWNVGGGGIAGATAVGRASLRILK